mmetsp:Transcript_8978/g.21408  ORF Transcript_8978/g.21408 Transcript_8978/m.21408 type:complete len:458 (+) Transcript_8978:3388-4761(+)
MDLFDFDFVCFRLLLLYIYICILILFIGLHHMIHAVFTAFFKAETVHFCLLGGLFVRVFVLSFLGFLRDRRLPLFVVRLPLEFFGNDRFEFLDVGGKTANPRREFFGRHGVLAEHHPKGFFVGRDLRDVHGRRFCGVEFFRYNKRGVVAVVVVVRFRLEFLDELRGDRQPVATGEFQDLVGVAEGRSHDDGVVPVFLVVVVDFRDANDPGVFRRGVKAGKGRVLRQFPRLVEIHDAPDKGRDQRRAGLGAGDRLGHAKNQRQVAGDALPLEDLRGPDSLPGGGDLDQYPGLVDAPFLVETDELPGLGNGCLRVEGEAGVDLRRDVAGDDLGDFDPEVDRDLVHRQRQVSLGIFDGVVDQLGVFRHDGGLGNEGRIGGGVLWLDLSDRVDVAGIGNDDGVFEELVVFRGHGCSSSSTSCCFCLLLVDCLFVSDVAGDGCCLGVLVLLLTGFVCVFLLY